MSKEQQVEKSLRWKKSANYCAKKLNLSLEEYIKIKNKLSTGNERVTESFIDENKGVGKLSGYLNNEPLSAEEIEVKFKVDTTKWRISQYWNKEKPSGGYFVSVNIISTKNSEVNLLSQVLDNIQLSYTPCNLNNTVEINEEYCGVISLQDIHVGKKTLELQNITKDTKDCVEILLKRALKISFFDKIFFVLGGDLLNMDSFLGTTTSGTVVENSVSSYEAYKEAFELMFWTINVCKQYCNTLEVVLVPGNHDRASSSNIAYALSKVFKDDSIIWNIEPSERKAVSYGINMLCFEHGDADINKSMFVFATEYASLWGNTTFRTLYTGHYHKKKTFKYVTEDELNGFQLKILPSLSKADYYHYHNKWTGNKRGGLIDIHCKKTGFIASVNHNYI